MRSLAILAARERSLASRSRWLAAFAAAFVALGLALTWAGAAAAGYGLGAFGPTTAALLNLVLLIVPLMALTAGALAIAGERERGALESLLALPVSRAEVFWGKFLGLSWALAAALALAFGALGAALAARAGAYGAGLYVEGFAATLLLAAVCLALGLAVSAASSGSGAAAGAALLAWLVLVFGGDLGLLGASAAMRLPPWALLAAAWLNPLSLYRLLAVDAAAAGLDVLGPAGRCAQDTLGAWLRPLALLGLLAWLAAALAWARARFCRRPFGARA